MLKLITTIPAVAALALAPAANAETVGTPMTVAIDYSDLDLANPEHLVQLRERIWDKVTDACTVRPSSLIALPRVDRDCRANAYAEALAILEQRTPPQLALDD